MSGFSADYLVTRTEGKSKSGANLQKAMGVGDPIKLLPFGTPLELIVDTNTKWKLVRTRDGLKGYVSDLNLTRAPSPAVARLIEATAHYWRLFNYGHGTEMQDPYHGYLVEIWKQIKMMPPKVGGAGPAKDRINMSHPDYPWSAAGISAIIRRASSYEGFKYSASHAKYIKASIKEKGHIDAPFWGLKIKDGPVRLGDLVCQWRGKQKMTYESAAATAGFFPSHTDVIVEIRKGQLTAIGCNNSNSVNLKKYTLTDDGYLAGPAGMLQSDKTVFMFMRNSCRH